MKFVGQSMQWCKTNSAFALQSSNMLTLDTLNIAFLFNLCSFALALLLVFKTNASYGRWLEARSAWAGIYISTRNLILKSQSFGPATMTQRQRLLIVRWVIALPYVLRSHLLSYVPGSLALEHLLTPDECAWLKGRSHMPLAVVMMIGSIIKSVDGFLPIYVGQLQGDLASCITHSTTCERLTRTPLPMAYTRCTVLLITSKMFTIIMQGTGVALRSLSTLSVGVYLPHVALVHFLHAEMICPRCIQKACALLCQSVSPRPGA